MCPRSLLTAISTHLVSGNNEAVPPALLPGTPILSLPFTSKLMHKLSPAVSSPPITLNTQLFLPPLYWKFSSHKFSGTKANDPLAVFSEVTLCTITASIELTSSTPEPSEVGVSQGSLSSIHALFMAPPWCLCPGPACLSLQSSSPCRHQPWDMSCLCIPLLGISQPC